MVLPLAGKPTWKRNTTPPSGRIRQALRSRISWPQRLTEMRPLFPEPLAWKENFPASRQRCGSEDPAERSAGRVGHRIFRGNPAIFAGTWMLTSEGEAKDRPVHGRWTGYIPGTGNCPPCPCRWDSSYGRCGAINFSDLLLFHVSCFTPLRSK